MVSSLIISELFVCHSAILPVLLPTHSYSTSRQPAAFRQSVPPKCPASTPAGTPPAPFSAGHTLILGACNAEYVRTCVMGAVRAGHFGSSDTLARRAGHFGKTCGTLWQDVRTSISAYILPVSKLIYIFARKNIYEKKANRHIRQHI